MSYIVIDVESDNPSPAIGSMVCFGAVLVSDTTKTFYGKTKPICDNWNAESLSISNISRQEHESFDDPQEVMLRFEQWITEVGVGRPIFISDNPAFDWQWINFYFWKYLNRNPFGHSARKIGDIYCGLMKNVSRNNDWKWKYRKTKHTHDPVQDCLGNAEALIAFRDELGLKINF